MNPELKKNLSSSHYWFRALYVLFFVFASEVAATILLFVAIGQIIFTLLTGKPNQRLTAFGSSLAEYLFSVFNFVCCKTEDKPFPFADWPGITTEVEDVERSIEQSEDSSCVQSNDPVNNTPSQAHDDSLANQDASTVNQDTSTVNQDGSTVNQDGSTVNQDGSVVKKELDSEKVKQAEEVNNTEDTNKNINSEPSIIISPESTQNDTQDPQSTEAPKHKDA